MFFSDIPRIPESSHPPLESSEYTLFVPLTELDLVLSMNFWNAYHAVGDCVVLRFLCEKKSLSESFVLNSKQYRFD